MITKELRIFIFLLICITIITQGNLYKIYFISELFNPPINPTPSIINITKEELKTTPYFDHHILPDGTDVLSCKGSKVPVSWPYKTNKPDWCIIKSHIMSRSSGINRISILRSGDELLWLSGFKPYSNCTLYVNDKPIEYKSDKDGIVFLADKPIPIVGVLTPIEISGDIDNNIITQNCFSVNELPPENISIIVMDSFGIVQLVQENTIVANCTANSNVPQIWATFRTLTNTARRDLVVNPVHLSLLSSKGNIQATVNEGKFILD